MLNVISIIAILGITLIFITGCGNNKDSKEEKVKIVTENYSGGKLDMDNDKVKYLMDMINNMDIKEKLRLSIRMSESNYINLKYDKPEMYEKFDRELKEIDAEYRTTIINFNKYSTITFVISKVMETSKEEQNQIFFNLYNKIGK